MAVYSGFGFSATTTPTLAVGAEPVARAVRIDTMSGAPGI